jgi:hypothetical protein
MRRIKRDERWRDVRVVLGKRDAAVLRAVARFRLCQTGDILTLFFGGIRRDTALRRLRRLHDAGFLEARVLALHEENAFALGPAGRRFAEGEELTAGPAPKGGEEHHLAIVRAWSGIAAAISSRADLRLNRFVPDWELRRERAGTDPRLVPDALMELGLGGVISRWALEVDLGNERTAVLRRKLLAYSAESAVTCESVGLAVVLSGAGARRRALVATLVQEHWTASSLICLQDEWPQALFSIVGETAKPPLTTWPYGNGGSSAPSPSENKGSDPQGEVHLR